MALSAWRKKPTCQLIAILDLIFAIVMIALYSYNFISDSRRNVEVFRGFLDFKNHWSTYVVLWVSIYMFNMVQFIVAFLLFSSLRPTYSDSFLVQYRAHRWLKFSSLIFLFLVIKTILYLVYLIKFGRIDLLTLAACILDIVFRIVTVYQVKKFTDDLRIQYPTQQPSVHFVSVLNKKPNNNQQA